VASQGDGVRDLAATAIATVRATASATASVTLSVTASAATIFLNIAYQHWLSCVNQGPLASGFSTPQRVGDSHR